MFDLSKVWPEWTAEEKLGEGAYGSVYKCVRRERGITSKCAIKIISVPHKSSEIDALKFEGYSEEASKEYFNDIVDNFANEIGVMENLKGFPNIVSIDDYKIVEHEDGIGWDIYIRMELLTSFREYIQQHQVEEQDVIKLGIDMCSALESCEKHGVMHRDIKPDNIFLDKNGNFKLGDFGVARQFEKTRSTMSDKGTPAYVAPEVVRERKYDNRVDIYSLGMVMYKLLNKNRDPFLDPEKQMIRIGERVEANKRRLSGEELPKPVWASEKTAAVILKACSYNPDKRFASAAEMKKALQALVPADEQVPVGEPVAAPVVNAPAIEKEKTVVAEEKKEASPQKQRRSAVTVKKVVAVFVALLLAALGAVGFKFIKPTKPSEETTTATTVTPTTTRKYSFAFQSPEDTAVDFLELYSYETAFHSDGRSLKVVEFGSYPQTLVDDSELLNELNRLDLDWISYEYYSGDGLLNFGSMKPSDYMEYADVVYDGSKYRAVRINDYRPIGTTGDNSILSAQFSNGYVKGNTYWFSYDPVKWYVVDEETGLLVSEKILDAQAFNNELYISIYGDILYSDAEKTISARDYEHSSVRSWLMDDFYNTVFSEEEKLLIKTSMIENEDYNSESGNQIVVSNTYDTVFLPSRNEITKYINDDELLKGIGTSYAKSQALILGSDVPYGSWYLRTSYDAANICSVSAENDINDSNAPYFVLGIRPAMYVVLSEGE